MTEIMKGYVAELEFEQYIGAQFNVWPKSLQLGGGPVDTCLADHPLYAELYQLFDYYLVPQPGVLVAVDLKNWARSTDSFRSSSSGRSREEAPAPARAPSRPQSACAVREPLWRPQVCGDQAAGRNHSVHVPVRAEHRHRPVDAKRQPPRSGSGEVMPIRRLDPNEVAHARLSALRFTVPVAEAARALARWQATQGSLLVPIAIPLPRATEDSPKG